MFHVNIKKSIKYQIQVEVKEYQIKAKFRIDKKYQTQVKFAGQGMASIAI